MNRHKVRKLNSYTSSSEKLTSYHFQSKWRRAYPDTVGGVCNLLKCCRVADINLDYVRELNNPFEKITPLIRLITIILIVVLNVPIRIGALFIFIDFLKIFCYNIYRKDKKRKEENL